MKSSTGAHFPALDHVRALAAFSVVAWHFTHGYAGSPVPFEGAPSVFPLALLDEGHTGVAVFMTLSGYLFAKLLDGRTIRYGAFLCNRALRLLPLLLLVCLVSSLLHLWNGGRAADLVPVFARGLYWPTLPNGGWSITVEAHFYLLLPLLLLVARRSPLAILALVGGAILLRTVLWWSVGQVQGPAYWSLVGRFDQFALGIFFFHARALVARRHALAAAVFLGFAAIYWVFDRAGGFLSMPGYPSPSPFWIVLPTIEGAAYALLIAWYDNSFAGAQGLVSRVAAKFGELSYSIYLLHFFFVFEAARVVHEKVMPISNFYLALAWAAGFYLLMGLPAWLTYRFVESPALRLRRPYFASGRAAAPAGQPASVLGVAVGAKD